MWYASDMKIVMTMTWEEEDQSAYYPRDWSHEQQAAHVSESLMREANMDVFELRLGPNNNVHVSGRVVQ